MLANQLHAAGVPVFPCTPKKLPAVTGWQTPKHPDTYNWSSGFIGVPIPAGVYVIDLDTYKGVTRQRVEQALGCALPWDQALIQTTMHGGQHYAFTSDWPVRQGTNLKDLDGKPVEGLDTRCAGTGLIVTGTGYNHVGFGPFALAHPSSLPRMPDAARPMLEKVAQAPSERAELPEGDKDVAQIRAALIHLDPGGSRSEWLQVGLALRHHFHDDQEAGLTIFDEWSSGCLWKDGEPENYDSETMGFQWGSFKPEGGITIASLFYAAMQAGWAPPPSFDTSLAFGSGAAPVDTFGAMIDRIAEQGCSAKHTNELLEAIAGMTCSPIQRDLLVTSLKYELRQAKLLDKKLGDRIDHLLRGGDAPQMSRGPVPALPDIMPLSELPIQQLGKPSAVHGINALSMLNELFRDRIALVGGVLRWWSGREWEPVDEETLDTITFHALMPDQSKKPNVSGTIAALRALCDKLDDPVRDTRAFFRNCVVNVNTGEAVAHNRNNLNIGTLQADFAPGSQCPEWFAFLNSMWGDQDDALDRSALLQEIVGWCLIRGNMNIQKIVAFDGASRAGKGAIFEVMQALIGDNSSGVVTFSDIDDGKTQSAFRTHDVMFDFEAKPPERQRMKKAIGFMNKLASNEKVSIQLLNTQTPWSGRINCKLLIACNGIPTMLDDSGATANRFLVLKFTRSFEGREDRGLVGRLMQELPGIALWALDGLRRLMANNGQFTEPATSVEAKTDMSEANQPLREFIAERMVFEHGARVHKAEIWAAYRLYVVEANVKLPTRAMFYHSLEQTLLGSTAERKASIRHNGGNGAGFIGLRLADHALPFAPLKVVK